jgi:PmbA protein
MVGKDKLMELVERVLKLSDCDQTQVTVTASESALTRYSNNYIHQNVSNKDIDVLVKVVMGKRIGIARSNDYSEPALNALLKKAKEIASSREEDPDFESLPAAQKVTEMAKFDTATAEQEPEERAGAVVKIIARAKKDKFSAAGSYSIHGEELAIGNSLGVRVYHSGTSANLVTVMLSGDSEGYAASSKEKAAEIDFLAVANEAADKAKMACKPQDLPAGEYDVVLESYGLGELVDWMCYLGFNGKAYLEGRSFLCDRLGKKIMGDNITIMDCGVCPESRVLPFDFEGVPRQKVVLIDKGVANAVVTDSEVAKKLNMPNTGHALPSGETFGPLPLHILIEGGDSELPKMVQELDKGLWVSHFHYVNGYVDPRNAVFTGMTRYGTFWVEGGKVKHPVKNLRFTESMLKAFSNVQALSKKRRTFGDVYSSKVLPDLLIQKFKFTGTTEH